MARNKNGTGGRGRRWLRRLLLPAVAIAIAAIVISNATVRKVHSMSLSDLDAQIRAGHVAEAVFNRDGTSVDITLKGDDTLHAVTFPAQTAGWIYGQLHDGHVLFRTADVSALDIALGVGKWLFWTVVAILGLSALASLNQYARKQRVEDGAVERPGTRFGDVAGIPEAVARAEEIRDIIKNPDDYAEVGARLPSGAVLYGPPGTGKTLLARAIAGEAGLPFYKRSGSQLTNKWFGGSAEKIRKLYEKAAGHPGGAIVFIDEADAIGIERSNNEEGGDRERRSALTQLLDEIDGFGSRKVFTLLATNQIDVLDPALIRPGRCDIMLEIGPPNIAGREAILKVHTRGKPLAKDINLREIAAQTTGAVGADLERLVNEAALVTKRAGAKRITNEHFCEAIETIEAGPRRKGLTISQAERRITAYHEAGHTLWAMFEDDIPDPVRVTIVPRGESGGHTRVAYDEDQLYVTVKQAKAQLAWMAAGRAAEKIACGPDNFTSGASSDLRQATRLAETMVCQWAMGSYNTSIPLSSWRMGPHAGTVEAQVEALLDDAEAAAIELLIRHMPALEAMVAELLEKETIGSGQLRRFSEMPPVTGDELAALRKRYQPVIDSVVREPREAALATAV